MHLCVNGEICQPATFMVHDVRGSPVHYSIRVARPRDRNMAARSDDAHMGPIPLPQGGTLTSAQRQEIWQRTGVSASVRWRQQWQQRCLTLSGPAAWLNEGKRLAEAAIEANGSEHGRVQDQGAQDVEELRRRFDWLNQYYHGQICTLQGQLEQVSRRASEAYDKALELAEILEKKNQKAADKKRKRMEKAKEKEEGPPENKPEDEGHGSASNGQKEETQEEPADERRDVRDPKERQEEQKARLEEDKQMKKDKKDKGRKTKERTPSPGPTEEQLRNIPWFKECYDMKVAAAPQEPWIKNKATYVAKSLSLHEGKEYEYYKRQCSSYGVTPATACYADQWTAKVEVKEEVKKEPASSSSGEDGATDTDVTIDSPRDASEAPTVIPVDENEAETEKQAASSQGGLPLTKIPEEKEDTLK